MKKLTLSIAACALVASTTVLAQNGNPNSQAGGLPALAAEVAELRALLEALQGQVGEPSYAGTYSVNLFEKGIFGCGSGNSPLPGGLSGYLQTQGISSTSQSSTLVEAISDGNTLSVAGHSRIRQELRLSGTFETDTPFDSAFDIDIAADGSLSLDAGPDVVFEGQMADDGSSFVVAVTGQFIEDDCIDAFTVTAVGVRQ